MMQLKWPYFGFVPMEYHWVFFAGSSNLTDTQ